MIQDLSEEDLELKRNLELMVERVRDPEPGVVRLALETLRSVLVDLFCTHLFACVGTPF